MVSIPIVWYPVYSPIHELSHVAATLLVGGKVTSIKLIPSFWRGEFGRAWITSEGITQSWQQLFTTTAPYILDVACLVTGIIVLQRTFSRNPFVVRLVFMLLCLRPAFDFACESVGFLTGDRGDFYAMQSIIGTGPILMFMVFMLGLSVLAVVRVLGRFVGFPETLTVAPKL